jgi:probable phosphoglycerate mutase
VSNGRRVTIEADGGSRGNPGPSGYGAVVFDADSGAVLAERKAPLGITTNNVAEYSGLIAGLEAAIELGASEVAVRMDSKLVIEQMSGRWQVKHPVLRPLAQRAQRLRSELGAVTFEWIPRERNKHADRLANEAMDEAAGRPARPSAPQPSTEATPNDGGLFSAPAAVPTNAPADPELGEEPTGRAGWVPPQNETPTRLVLLRHGQTAHSAQYRFSGRTDLPLNGVGQSQAQAAARRVARFDPVVVISSPLRRARQTAETVISALGRSAGDLIIEDGFAENDFGDWEGLTTQEIGARWKDEFAAWQTDQSVSPPGGESIAAVNQRVRPARDRILRAYPGQTVVIVSHVVAIKSLLVRALGAPPEAFRSIHLDPACLSVIDFYGNGASVVRVINEGAFNLDATVQTPKS